MKVCGSGGLDPCILNHGIGRRQEINVIFLLPFHTEIVTHVQRRALGILTPQKAQYYGENSHDTDCICMSNLSHVLPVFIH
jgi:hypothetical protein